MVHQTSFSISFRLTLHSLNSSDSPDPILDPMCKIAMIIGGANGFGFAAADHLLCEGAQSIIIADDNERQGKIAAQRLCDAHGKDRACFFQCDIRNLQQFEGVFKQVCCKFNEVHILFNDLDKDRLPLPFKRNNPKQNRSNTARAIQVGVSFISRQNGGPGGVIINCASILGFMGWPQDPSPVYCMKEPAIETTMDLAKKFSAEETGVRLIALCPTSKPFSDISLPNFPESVNYNRQITRPECIPTSTWKIRAALNYVLARAKTGSTYVVEPSTSPHDIPRLIHFPEREGDKIDPKVYEPQPCQPALNRCAVILEDKCPPDMNKDCEANIGKKK